MTASYAVLIMLIGASAASYGLFDEGWIRDWSSNIGAGLVGSLVIIFTLDRAAENRRRREQQRVRTVALSQLRPPLMRHLILLANWYKAAIPSSPDEPPSDFSQLLGDDFLTQLGQLDFSKEGPTFPPMSWFRYTRQELDDFRSHLERIVDKYAVFLESN